MPSVNKDTRVLKDPVTGELISVPAAEADARAAAEGLDFATLNEIQTKNDREKYGSAGQTALAATELALETATLGLAGPDTSEAGRKRREVLRRESPIIGFGAELAGTVPGVLAGGGAGALARGAGAGARAAGIASAVAEGGVSAYAQEQVLAREEGRDIDIGNILLYGVGGEIAGRVVPKALGSGLNRIADALTPAKALGDQADNVLVRAEQRAAQSGTDIAEALPGPERDRFLRDNARDLTNQASERARSGLDAANRQFQDLGDLSKKRRKIANLVSKEHPGQDRWVNDQLDALEAARLEANGLASAPGLAGMSKKLEAFLVDAEAKLTSSRKAADRFIEADGVKRGLQKFHVSLSKSRMQALDPVYHEQMMSIVDAVQENMRRGLEDESLWGRAGRFQADVNSAWHNRWFKGAPVAEADLARITGRDFDAKAITEFDPAKLRSFLEKDKVGRGLTEEKLNDMLDGYQEMAEAHRKWGITDEKALDKLQRDVADVRKTLEEADEIQSSVPRADKADAAEAAMDSLVSQGLPVVGSAYVGLKRALRNVNTAGKSHVRSSMSTMVNGVRRVGRGLKRVGQVGGPVGVVAAGHLRERQTTDARFRGDFPNLTQAFMARREQIVTALQEPEQLAAAVADSFGDLPDQFPDVHFRLSERFTQAFMYLGDNLPPGIENSLLSQHALPPDLRSIREFARLWEAVMDPGAVVADFASMTATPKQARAIEAVHPDLWAQMQMDTLEAVANSPKRPSWERMRYTAQMFQLGGALGGVWKPTVARNISNSLKVAPPASMDRPATPLPTSPSNPRGIASITNGPTSGSA